MRARKATDRSFGYDLLRWSVRLKVEEEKGEGKEGGT